MIREEVAFANQVYLSLMMMIIIPHPAMIKMSLKRAQETGKRFLEGEKSYD